MGGTDMKRFVLGAVTAIIGVGVIALAVPLTGLYNVAATERDVGPVAWLLHTTYHQSVQRRARDVDVPADYASDASVLIGARNFDAMCSTCHTPPGLGDTPVATGLNPQPPALLDIADHSTPAEQFWVIDNGVRMTGMPAFGPTHESSELWGLVGFLQAMKGADANTYRSLVTRAGKVLDADDGHDHRHGPGDDSSDDGSAADAPATDGDGDHPHSDTDDGHAHDHGSPPPTRETPKDDHSDHDHSHAEPTKPLARNDAEALANEFYDALADGDEVAVRRVLADQVLIFESGGVESSMDEYAGHHMPSDMAFLQQAKRVPLSRISDIEGDRAWVATRSRLTAQLGDRAIDVISTETLVMHLDAEQWRIAHVHWSSGKANGEH